MPDTGPALADMNVVTGVTDVLSTGPMGSAATRPASAGPAADRARARQCPMKPSPY